MKVKSMKSLNGNSVPNQFIIETKNGMIFQSYQSVIVEVKNGKTSLDKNKWDYSKTTGKYRNAFLGETKKETEQKIKNKIYILKDLNK